MDNTGGTPVCRCGEYTTPPPPGGHFSDCPFYVQHGDAVSASEPVDYVLVPPVDERIADALEAIASELLNIRKRMP